MFWCLMKNITFLTVSWLSGLLSAEIVQMPTLTEENSHFLWSGSQKAALVNDYKNIWQYYDNCIFRIASLSPRGQCVNSPGCALTMSRRAWMSRNRHSAFSLSSSCAFWISSGVKVHTYGVDSSQFILQRTQRKYSKKKTHWSLNSLSTTTLWIWLVRKLVIQV